jgi:transposase
MHKLLPTPFFHTFDTDEDAHRYENQLRDLLDRTDPELLKAPVPHADETPMPMLKPGKGKTHRAYMWSWCTTQFHSIKAVVFDVAETRGGQNARDFLAPGHRCRLEG